MNHRLLACMAGHLQNQSAEEAEASSDALQHLSHCYAALGDAIGLTVLQMET